MTDVQTTMLLLDEVHNLRTHRASGAEAASTVKMLSDRLDATFVYAGIDLTRTDLFAGDIGSQIRSRMILHEIHPYPLATRHDHTEWSELVAGCENQLILARHPTGSLLAHADYLHARTHGRLGALRGLLCDSAARAILNGTEKITKRLLDTVPTDLQVHTEPGPAPATRTPPRLRQRRA